MYDWETGFRHTVTHNVRCREMGGLCKKREMIFFSAQTRELLRLGDSKKCFEPILHPHSLPCLATPSKIPRLSFHFKGTQCTVATNIEMLCNVFEEYYLGISNSLLSCSFFGSRLVNHNAHFEH
jgi:hypothetical protein